jgi:type II secretory pathway component PulK
MNSRGFALLAVLWVLTALTVLTGVALDVARTGELTTRNRVLLARAGWAREACLEILLARYAQEDTVRRVDTIGLGRGTWCMATIEDPAARLNLNRANRESLAKLLSVIGCLSSVADSIVAFRRRAPIYDVRQIPSVDSTIAALLAPYVTTRGTGVVAVNSAPKEVLATLPGISDEAIAVILRSRDARRLQNPDELMGLLSRPAQAVLFEAYSEFGRAAEFTPQQLEAVIDGGVSGTTLRSRAILILVPGAGRLAVVRRETE